MLINYQKGYFTCDLKCDFDLCIQCAEAQNTNKVMNQYKSAFILKFKATSGVQWELDYERDMMEIMK